MRKRPTKERGRRPRKKPLVDSKFGERPMGKYATDYARSVLEPGVERREIVGWKYLDAYVGNVPVHFVVIKESGRLVFVVIDNEEVTNTLASDMGMSQEFWNGPQCGFMSVRYVKEWSFRVDNDKPEFANLIFIGSYEGARSKTEMRFHNHLESLLQAGSVGCLIYEPCPIRYPGITYTPDFAVWENPSRRVVFYEVKSAKDVWHSADKSSIMMRVMGAMFHKPGKMEFVFATSKQGEWKFTKPKMMATMKKHPQLP
jgi:hypothetical protein